ncbi:MAG: aspartate kinase [Deltaproteobacteria bacterium]|nr:aspartate kinase [Deltaproteobacteria bacterium]MBW2533311.1 aspartate kinase [Deltaproteobacteria bacterium]
MQKELKPPASPARPPIVVQKYGGSSVADVAKLGKVADRIVATRRAGNDVVVVVSAMGKATDDLLRLAGEVSTAGRADAEPPRRELDMLVSTGERVAMALLSIAIQARGLQAISFTGSQCGIITNDRHFDARIIEVRPHRIEDELARGCVVIVAGYQGMSYKREITTLGRGGSDTTAVALAAALDAKQCEIYSDVDGVYSADPRVVPDAAHLPELGYDSVQEMAESGAKVLCAQAVEWARRAGIALYARSTFDRIEAAPRQTLIRKFGPSSQPRARAVVADRDVVLGTASLDEPAERIDEVLQLLTDAGVRLRQVHHQEAAISLVLSVTNAPQWAGARRDAERLVPSLGFQDAVALVSVTGSGLTDDARSVARFRRLLTEIGARPRLLDASALRLSAVIDEAALQSAQQRLHDELVADR